MLVSTLVPETWVVLAAGCTQAAASNCPDSRGTVFVPSASKTWSDQKTWSLGVEVDLGYSDRNAGNYGYDTLGVLTSAGGVVLDHQNIAGIATTDFYMGSLGLAARTPDFNGNTQESFLNSLKDGKRIPSLAYSYTAGASYSK